MRYEPQKYSSEARIKEEQEKQLTTHSSTHTTELSVDYFERTSGNSASKRGAPTAGLLYRDQGLGKARYKMGVATPVAVTPPLLLFGLPLFPLLPPAPPDVPEAFSPALFAH